MKHALLVSSIATTCAVFSLLFFALDVSANMSSDNYVIQMGNFNITSGEKNSDSFKVTDTVGQTAPGQYGLSGYVVKAGFQYIYVRDVFAFSISNTHIDLGELTSGSFSNSASTTLTVSASGAGGYTVYAYENKPLTNQEGTATISDTTCDGNSCTEITAGTWSNPSNPGFGFTMTGDDIPASFANGTKYKQFANFSNNEPAQIVMQKIGLGKNRQSTVRYQATIPGSQPAGNYENMIIFIATPGY